MRWRCNSSRGAKPQREGAPGGDEGPGAAKKPPGWLPSLTTVMKTTLVPPGIGFDTHNRAYRVRYLVFVLGVGPSCRDRAGQLIR
jgi:hypothetical protein